MARTSVFSALRRVYRIALGRVAMQTSGEAPPERSLRAAPRRRDVLRAVGLGLPAATLSGCGDDDDPVSPTPSGGSIAIIGGGIAGLHCAYRLRQAGLDATVYEAQNRVGGRMFTAKGPFADAPDQLCELGGELIDSGHETLRALAEEFELTLDDRLTNEDPGFVRDVWFVGGVAIPEDVITTQFVAVAPAMAADLEAAESDDDAYASLDETTLDEYLTDKVPPAQYPELHQVLQAAYRGEYGLESDRQSALNLIYLIGADEPDPFRIFGVSDERYHAHLGSGSFPEKLAEALDPGQIKLEHSLKRVSDLDRGFELVFARPTGEVTVNADRVVFALPFSTLREVDLAQLTLSDRKRTIIDTLGYGTNAKIMMGFSERIWRLQYNTAGALTTDLSIQQTWETTIGQAGTHGILTNFVGGDAGVSSGDGTPESWAASVIPDLETVWPGAEEAFTGTAVRMHWPTVPTMKGSYACYHPGQWDFYGDEGTREGNLYFCGEHTSLDFQGYMEGGAETGALVAAEIIEDLALAKPTSLVIALGVKLIIPQACYRANRWGRLNPFVRRQIARKQITDALARASD